MQDIVFAWTRAVDVPLCCRLCRKKACGSISEGGNRSYRSSEAGGRGPHSTHLTRCCLTNTRSAVLASFCCGVACCRVIMNVFNYIEAAKSTPQGLPPLVSLTEDKASLAGSCSADLCSLNAVFSYEITYRFCNCAKTILRFVATGCGSCFGFNRCCG